MAATNHDRVGKAMELLKKGLGPFVEREFKSAYKDRAAAELQRFLSEDRLNAKKAVTALDVAALLKLMWDSWNDVFRMTLGPAERSLVSELRDHRNKWAHQEAFSSDDTYRALDSSGRLLTAVSAPQADEIEKMKTELLRIRFDEQARNEKRKSAGTAIETAAAGGLKPWREVVTPHQDVASGHYQQAEFAADLWQVHLGEGTDEYKNPVEFFRRTYLTESLKRMLVGAVRRLAGRGGDPVVQLQTNFGGGKTHSMLRSTTCSRASLPRSWWASTPCWRRPRQSRCLLPRQVSSACCCILTRRASEGSASEPALARRKICEI